MSAPPPLPGRQVPLGDASTVPSPDKRHVHFPSEGFENEQGNCRAGVYYREPQAARLFQKMLVSLELWVRQLDHPPSTVATNPWPGEMKCRKRTPPGKAACRQHHAGQVA